MATRPMSISIDQQRVEDLVDRIGRARFASSSSHTEWGAGVDPAYLAEFATFWGQQFDWRVAESELNRLDHRLADVSGVELHCVRFEPAPGTPTSSLPVLLAHGWPSSFLEMVPLAQRLSNPAAFGRQGPAREVIVPSLPGFGFSGLPAVPLTRSAMAELFHSLMAEQLGHQRYFVFGGDIGGAVGGWMGSLFPDHVAGVHLIHPPFPSTFEDPPLTKDEQAFLEWEDKFDEEDRGYSEIMGTRPDTVAAALVDSPVGLAAWIVDKLRDWSDCGGDLESRFTKQDLATLVSLYWLTDSIGTSFRQYLDWQQNTPRPPITVPTGFTLSTELSAPGFPRSIAERACSDIRKWSEPASGGHFLAFEEPDLMADELCSFFSLVT
jgi:pimeloyl-ACP methyl ester carboxylesterase